MGLAGVAAKDGFAGRDLYKVKGGQGEQNKYSIGEPGVESSQAEPLRHMIDVQKLEDVEVEQIKAIATFANE